MLQRQKIVPARRKQQNQQNSDDFYGDEYFEGYEFEEITSLLSKRLKFENNDEQISEGKKIKRCCVDEGKFISLMPQIEIYAPSPQPQNLETEIRSQSNHASHPKNKEKKQSITQNNVEFKSIIIGEVDYVELLNACELKEEMKCSRKKHSKQELTKKIHKL